MEHLLNLDSLISLLTLSLLEIVLGIDNVIFVSILMGRIPAERRLAARRLWMVLGIAARILLLSALGWLVRNGSRELFGLDLGARHVGFNLRNVILFAGGLFLLYKTVKEIHAKLEGEESIGSHTGAEGSFWSVMGQIILIDMVFSFDSIITAVGMARHVEVMAVAVIVAMIIMFYFADSISRFIHRHPTLKMLALSFLLMVGFSLFFEGLEPMHGSHIDKGYIYVAMAFSFGVELLNMRLRKKLEGKPAVELREPHA
ncbi:MAG: TerC family protein [Chitinophagia bacterium]|nr:TerC family protein [Chitinophagia bacterium]